MLHLSCYLISMKNLKFIILTILFSFILSACQTIKDKTDAIIEKENQRLSKYIGKPSNLLKNDLGNPNEDFKNEKGNLVLVYNTKKYGIPCERRFELDSNSVVIGFISNGCF